MCCAKNLHGIIIAKSSLMLEVANHFVLYSKNWISVLFQGNSILIFIEPCANIFCDIVQAAEKLDYLVRDEFADAVKVTTFLGCTEIPPMLTEMIPVNYNCPGGHIKEEVIEPTLLSLSLSFQEQYICSS